jgi:two-component system NtrC family response regulator
MDHLNNRLSTYNTQHPTLIPEIPSPKPRLLIVDDDSNLRTQMKWALAQDYDVVLAEDRPSAVGVVERKKPRVVMLDLGLPPRPQGVEEGFLALSEILQQDALIKVIIATGQTEKEHALKAIGEGACDFLCKPIQMDELRVILKRTFNVYQLEKECLEMQSRLGNGGFEEMLGSSPQMQAVFAKIRKVATTNAPVLIMGKSGTGKELVARAIHRLSIKRNGPFVVINCGAIPESLLESELFGHEKGAFTGAHIQRKGRIEMASGGTLLLDEVGELSPALQVKLLRFLQEQRIERVGGREPITADARILAATNVNLEQAMMEGHFREDLYYRLAVVKIALPTLRERGEDILLLARMLQQRYAAEINKKVTGFSKEAIIALQNYSWPGNIREIENRIRRAVIMAEGPRLTPAHLELKSEYDENQSQGLLGAREALEKEMIEQALARHKGNVARTAAELAVSRPTLYVRMKRLGIEKNRSRKKSFIK